MFQRILITGVALVSLGISGWLSVFGALRLSHGQAGTPAGNRPVAEDRSGGKTNSAKGLLVQVRHRSPVDVKVSPDGNWLVSANQGSQSISLLNAKDGKLVDEFACPSAPGKLAWVDAKRIVVSCQESGTLLLLTAGKTGIRQRRRVEVGFHPLGLAVRGGESRIFVGLEASGEVAEVDLASGKVARRIAVGRWPRYLAWSPDGRRLAVGLSGESKIAVVDVPSGKTLYTEPLVGGINLGHMQCSADSKYVYFPWMVYRNNPISPFNIRKGWVLASRIGRVRLDGESYREAISLDVPRQAVSDPHGLAFTGSERRLVVSASGTHELLVYRNGDLPYIGAGGPGDLIDRRLMRDNDLFYRIELGGRPMGLAMGADERTAYVANYSRDSIQVVDIETRKLKAEYPLGPRPSKPSLVRRGMEIFYDGRRSLDQWYSCHSCHYNGGSNARAMDTMNDGSELTFKTVLPLYHLSKTGPWTWHGWQRDLHDAMNKSFRITMQGDGVSKAEARAVLAFLDSLRPPRNPFRQADGSLSAAAMRGKKLFQGKGGCASCHSGPLYTDGRVHDVGLGEDEDAYQGFNTPSLLSVYRKVRLLHDGRATTLEEVLSDEHAPEKVAGEPLKSRELKDLIAFLRSL